jgi:hypothetical protein
MFASNSQIQPSTSSKPTSETLSTQSQEQKYSNASAKSAQPFPYLQVRYHNLHVLFGDHVGVIEILSTAGFSQGCPLSSALFQMTMSELLSPLRQQHPDSLVLSLHDDNYITFDSLEKFESIYNTIKSSATDYNLTLNSKTCLFSSHPITPQQSESTPSLKHVRRP